MQTQTMATIKATLTVERELFDLKELQELINEAFETNLAVNNGEIIIFLDIENIEITGGQEGEF